MAPSVKKLSVKPGLIPGTCLVGDRTDSGKLNTGHHKKKNKKRSGSIHLFLRVPLQAIIVWMSGRDYRMNQLTRG